MFYFPLGNNLFNNIAANEAARIGEPNKYCTNVGKEFK